MPIETRLFVKASLIWLLATFAFGAVMIGAKALGIAFPVDAPVMHAHMGFIGWLVNLVMGIALWFLPVNRERFKQNRGRYPAGAVQLVFALLNAGLVARMVAEPLFDRAVATALTSAVLILSGVMQFTAVLIFVLIAWSRVRNVSTATREFTES